MITRSLLPVLLAVLACGGEPPPPPPPPDAGCTATTTVYPDSDGDSYGSATHSGVTICAGAALAGHVSNRLDCADGDARAHPNATTWETTAIQGLTANQWDFNCDGTATLQYPGGRSLCNLSGPTCFRGAPNNWFGDPSTPPPACGETANWLLSCSTSCQRSLTSRTQGCM